MPKKGFIPNKLKPWIEARKKYHLSHAQIQMARELGLNPRKFGSLGNIKQQSWKLPLPDYIEKLYFKHYGKSAPEHISSIEDKIKEKARKKTAKKIIKRDDR
ncbi:MAG: hypothetical protein KAG56_10720 [Sulfurovaceae bacterium]|nr:hypothetical protein [Sulfurovaceae bacterium]